MILCSICTLIFVSGGRGDAGPVTCTCASSGVQEVVVWTAFTSSCHSEGSIFEGIELHVARNGDRTSFRVKGLRGTPWNRNFTSVFGERTSFCAKGLRFVPSRWHCPCLRLQNRKKEIARWQENKRRRCDDMRARGQEGKKARGEDVKMWGCEAVKMWGWEDVRCEDVRMRRCEDDVKMSRCEDVKSEVWRW